VLSATEAGRLEHWNIWPKCKNHWHVKRREALAMIADDTHRFVGGEDTAVAHPVSMIVPTVCGRMWSPQSSCGLQGFKVWGLRRLR